MFQRGNQGSPRRCVGDTGLPWEASRRSTAVGVYGTVGAAELSVTVGADVDAEVERHGHLVVAWDGRNCGLREARSPGRAGGWASCVVRG